MPKVQLVYVLLLSERGSLCSSYFFFFYSKVCEFYSSNVRRLSCHSTTPGTSQNSRLLIVSDTNIATSGDTTKPTMKGNVYSTRTTRCSELECDHSAHSSMYRLTHVPVLQENSPPMVLYPSLPSKRLTNIPTHRGSS